MHTHGSLPGGQSVHVMAAKAACTINEYATQSLDRGLRYTHPIHDIQPACLNMHVYNMQGDGFEHAYERD